MTNNRDVRHGGGLGAVLLAAALGSAALAGCGSNQSADTAPPPPSTAPVAQAPAANSTAVAPVAATGSLKEAAAAWKQVQAANQDLDKVIKSKNLKTVHEAAFKVRDLVKSLPAKSQALPPDKQKSLASQVKNVEQLAGKLDEAGDSNNLKETQENQAGLNDALDIIKALYPAGALT